MCYIFALAAVAFSDLDASWKLFLISSVFFVGGFFHWLVYYEEKVGNEKK